MRFEIIFRFVVSIHEDLCIRLHWCNLSLQLLHCINQHSYFVKEELQDLVQVDVAHVYVMCHIRIMTKQIMKDKSKIQCIVRKWTDLWWHESQTYSYDETWKSLTKKLRIHKLLFWIFKSDRWTRLKWVSQSCHIITKNLWWNSQTADRNNTVQVVERICHHVSMNWWRSLIQ